MDGKEFWTKVDEHLRDQGLTITELATLIGQSRNTLFVQRNRFTVPKAEQIKRMEQALRCSLIEDDSFLEYLPYLRNAEEWQLRSVRQILNMPEPASKKDGSSTTAVS